MSLSKLMASGFVVGLGLYLPVSYAGDCVDVHTDFCCAQGQAEGRVQVCIIIPGQGTCCPYFQNNPSAQLAFADPLGTWDPDDLLPTFFVTCEWYAYTWDGYVCIEHDEDAPGTPPPPLEHKCWNVIPGDTCPS